MLSALELLHYSERFSGQLFAFNFECSNDCELLLVDLRVLHAANIKQVLFCAADDSLLKKLELWNRSGHRFRVFHGDARELQSAAFIGQLQRALGEGNLPLVVLRVAQDSALEIKTAVVHCSVALGALKVFFPGPLANFTLDGRVISCPRPKDIERAHSAPADSNLAPELLEFFSGQQQLHQVEIVMLAAQRGAIFREVFTHFGSGTLFTNEFANVLRPAQETDVRDILAIMQPYFNEGTIKPMDEDELLGCIRRFTVFSVNEQIVALAALIEHDDCFELAKLCTLIRYQARGRARRLVETLQEKTREAGKRGLFALTVHQYVGDFFVQMGFEPCERESLPQVWQANYDMSRPSKAYWFKTS